MNQSRPSPLHSLAFDELPLVGREQEAAFVRERLEQARSGRGSTVLLAGEPGIGKSRLAEEIARDAREQEALVLWGRCYESAGAPAYWPWIQVLRSLTADVAVGEALDTQGSAAAYIAQLVPEVRQRLPDVPEAGSLEPESVRFLLFDSIATFLRLASADRPLVLILEDLHGADEPSLLLLQFLAAELRASRVLIVGTYRDTPPHPSGALGHTLAELARGDSAAFVHLKGLTPGDVEQLLAVQDAGIPASLARVLHEKTDGNPLFLREMLRLLLEQDGDVMAGSLAGLPLPVTAGEVIEQRFAQVSGRCRDVLTYAAVFGRDFDAEPLQQVCGSGPGELVDVLDEAITARLLVRRGSRDGYRFSHALMRDFLYAGIGSSQRARMHYEAGWAIEAAFANNLEPYLAELAHHFREGAAAGDIDKAIEYARLAGDNAQAKFAYEEAVRHYRAAIEALDRAGCRDDRRCDLLLLLGDMYSRLRDLAAADEVYLRAAELARDLDAPERMATAVLGIGGRIAWTELLQGSPRLVALCREALALLDEESPLRAKVRGRLAAVVQLGGDMEEAHRLLTEALDEARQQNQDSVIAYVLEAGMPITWGVAPPQERAAWVKELIERTRRIGDREREYIARYWQVLLAVEVADLPTADVQMAALDRLARELHQPTYGLVVRTLQAERAMLEGRFEEAEALISGVAASLSQAAQQSEVLVANNAMQQLALRRERGGLEAMESALLGFAEEYADMPVLRVLLAYVFSETGKREEAKRHFEYLAADDFGVLPRDIRWPFAIGLLAEVCGFLGDAERAAVLYELLLPLAERNITIVEDFCTGSASRNLGILAGTLRRWEAACRHFEEALAMNQRIGALPALAHTRHEYARALLQRRSPAGRAIAFDLLEEAETAARDMSMQPLLDKIEATRRAVQQAQPGGLTEREVDVLRLIAAGHSNREVAQELVLSERTVERHISNVYTKIGARSRAVATAFALQHGII